MHYFGIILGLLWAILAYLGETHQIFGWVCSGSLSRRIFFVEGMMIRVLVLDFVVIRHVFGHDLVLPIEAVLRAIVLRRFIADASCSSSLSSDL